jgi:hypothetical protein
MATTESEKERWRLSRVYGGMSVSEVERLAADAGSLSDDAKWALKLDLMRRGLKTELTEKAPPRAAATPSRLVTLRQYMTLPEALLSKSILDSAGIESFLGDQHIVRMDWFLSNALGGVKLRVREEDAEAAAELLDRGGAGPRLVKDARK